MLVKRCSRILAGSWWMLAIAQVVSAGIACLSNPCQHGICIDDVNSTYSCYCVDGYTGVQCQTNWDECWSDPCQNGGTCIDGIAAYNCSCPEGFIGDNCETNYNECESNPCQNNGTCIDMTNGYVCACAPGFVGDHCEVDIAVCNSTEEVRCYNGGQCIEGPGFKFYCKCAAGWAGPKCEDQIDECESNPCQNNGVCIDVHSDYMCACAYGFTGKSCETAIEFCNSAACSNNALCVVEDGQRVCYCVPDYHGPRCELQYDECLLGPRCMNGGTCIDGVDNFTCSCPPMLTGALCECLILEDGSYDCEYVSPTPDYNQTTFINVIDGYTTTTDVNTIVTTYTPAYANNDTLTTAPIDYDTGTSTAATLISSVTTTDSTDTTTDQSNVVTDVDVTAIAETITYNVPTEASEAVPKETIGSDDSVKETTTECLDCERPISTEITTEMGIIVTTMPEPTKAQVSTEAEKHSTIPTVVDVGTTASEGVPPQPSSTESVHTPKMDTTTGMFTDSPTEPVVTELPLPATTTEVMEVTSPFDNITTTSTHGYTTAQTECTESVCNNHGTCINTPQGIRCRCIFKYSGTFCDEKISIRSAAFGGKSYITHTVRNTTSIAIAFNAKTLITDGQMMQVDIAKGVYMQLYVNSGLLKFKFSCGYQTMLLSELKTFVNRGYLMKIETRLDLYLKEQHCNATLRLNDTVAMSGGQVANISSIDYNSTIYLGNSPDIKDDEHRPFVGCIRDLMVNNENRDIFGDALDAYSVTECSSLSCLSGPCLNGGTCSDDGNGYVCSCANGWIGSYCNQSVCENNPCKSGGSCVPHPGSGFLCLCPYGKHGIFCEYNIEITRPSLAPITTGVSSFLIYPLSPSVMNSDRFDLRLRFLTTDMDQIALLAFVGQNGRHDSRSQHLALTIVKGYVMLTWNMGSGARRIFTSRALSSRRGGHAVRVWRRGRAAGLSVDARHNVSGNAPASDARTTLVPYIYIGGHPSEHFHDLPHDLPLHSGWRGCIWEVGGQAVGSGKAVGGRGVGQCGVAQCSSKSCNAPRGVCIHSPATYGCICNEGWFGATCSAKQSPCDSSVTKCKGRCVITADKAECDCPYGKTGVHCDQDLIPTDVLFSGIRSYVQLHAQPISSVSLALEAEIKPTKESGLILFAETPHFYTSLSLQGGLLEYRWTERASGVTSLVRSGVLVSPGGAGGAWRGVRAGRYGNRLYVWADGALATDHMLAHAYPHTASNATVYIGGARDLAALPFDTMSGATEAFSGCIRNVHINNVLLTLEPHNIKEGQNVADCDGTACGGEACGGAACALRAGRASCACAHSDTHTDTNTDSDATTRCRRQVECTAATCGAPGGSCRRGVCVCAAGYAGDHCQQTIKVTIPQFDGNALLSLSRAARRPLAPAGPEQRLRLPGRPSYISINFTTPEPNGLLLWAVMGIDYIGIGFENGYLKMAWYFHHDNSTFEVFTRNSKYPETPRFLTRMIPEAGFLADAEWHTLVLRMGRNNVTVTVDKILAFMAEPGLGTELDYGDVDLFLGGITEEVSAIAKNIFPKNFKGCIDHISTKEDIFTTNYTEMYSENLKSCQLFP